MAVLSISTPNNANRSFKRSKVRHRLVSAAFASKAVRELAHSSNVLGNLVRERRLIQDFYTLVREVEKCKRCQGILGNFESCHEKKWNDLMERVRKFLSEQPS